MTDPIEPALSAEEFESLRNGALSEVSLTGVADILTNPYEHDEAKSAARIIAAMNARLPDSDPRKITREAVERIRYAAKLLSGDGMGFVGDFLTQHAAALESYLPPERR